MLCIGENKILWWNMLPSPTEAIWRSCRCCCCRCIRMRGLKRPIGHCASRTRIHSARGSSTTNPAYAAYHSRQVVLNRLAGHRSVGACILKEGCQGGSLCHARVLLVLEQALVAIEVVRHASQERACRDRLRLVSWVHDGVFLSGETR